MNEHDPVWYVAYGSNLLRERFLCYVTGGEFLGRAHRGCADPTPPRDEFGLVLPFERYFAHNSSFWGGGVAFLDPLRRGETVARAYLLTYGQFLDVFAQENGWRTRHWEKRGWYRATLGLGDDGAGVRLMTFTEIERARPVRPSERYLDVIRRGEAEVDALP